MTKELKDQIRREELAFKAYANVTLQEAYPNADRRIESTTICPITKRRRIGVWINNEYAFGAGNSNAAAVEKLLSDFKPSAPEQRADFERTHISNLTPKFSDHV